MSELEIIELKDGDVMPFTWKTERYGRAEFTFCWKWKRWKLADVWISPKQQPDAKAQYHLGGLQCDNFQVYSYTHKGFENPWPWLYGWCREHKCQYMHVYVPPRATLFRVRVLSTLVIIFE